MSLGKADAVVVQSLQQPSHCLVCSGYRSLSRTLQVFVVSFLMASPTAGQSPGVSVGLKAGGNFSGFHGRDIGDVTTRVGHLSGVFVHFDREGALSFQSEAYYSKMGAEAADIFSERRGVILKHGVWSYDYLNVAALLKLRLNAGRAWLPSLSLFMGPVGSALVSAQTTGSTCSGALPVRRLGKCVEDPSTGHLEPHRSVVNHQTKASDFGAIFGADLELKVGSVKLVLDARYTTMMREFDQPPFSDQFSRKHNALSVQIGVGILPSFWPGNRRTSLSAPPQHSITMMELIAREDIAVYGEASVRDIIGNEQSDWMDGDEVAGTLFVDGEVWMGSRDVLLDRSGAEVEEILWMDGAPGAYAEFGVVIEIITRGEPWR